MCGLTRIKCQLFSGRDKNFDLSDSLNRYTGSIDIICGRQDILAFITYELKLFKPSIFIYWIEELGHFPMNEQPGSIL